MNSNNAQSPDPEYTYPELRLKRLRARLSLVLFTFSAVIFGTMPFYRPDQPSDHQFHPWALVTLLLPLAFLVIFIRATLSLKYLRGSAAHLASAEQRDVEAELYMSNFNSRRGRAFNYRVVIGNSQPVEGIVESTEFVAGLGYSEKGGEVMDEASGKKLFGHKLVAAPVYRKLKLKLKGYYRPGVGRPFLLIGDGVRIWLRDELSR